MPITIFNRGPANVTGRGVRDYELVIQKKSICKFKHKREDGLAVCLEKAAKAVRAQHEQDLLKIVRGEGK
jgi:hypothetical protein